MSTTIERCRLCRGRVDLEDPEHGGDFTCWQCDGTGDQSNVCRACSGRRVWQMYDGAVQECPVCAGDL